MKNCKYANIYYYFLWFILEPYIKQIIHNANVTIEICEYTPIMLQVRYKIINYNKNKGRLRTEKG